METQKFDIPPGPSPKRWVVQFALRVATAICSLLVLALTGQPASTNNYVALLILSAPAGLSFLWSVADGMCRIFRHAHRGITPGARVGVDLIIVLGYICCEVVTGVLETAWTNEEYPSDREAAAKVRAMVEAGLAFGAIATILHIVQLVVACRETHRLNREVRILRASVMPLNDM